MGKISYSLYVILNFYSGTVLLWCILTFFPNIDWEKQPAKFLNMLVSPYLNLFRGLIPSAGGLDFSPMIAMAILYFVGQFIIKQLASMGL